MSATHFSLRLDALSLSLGGLPDGPTAPELEADPAVGVAHDDHREEVGEDHKAHVVPGSCRSKRGESSGGLVKSFLIINWRFQSNCHIMVMVGRINIPGPDLHHVAVVVLLIESVANMNISQDNV